MKGLKDEKIKNKTKKTDTKVRFENSSEPRCYPTELELTTKFYEKL